MCTHPRIKLKKKKKKKNQGQINWCFLTTSDHVCTHPWIKLKKKEGQINWCFLTASHKSQYFKRQTHQHQLTNTVTHQRIKSKKTGANKLNNYKDLKRENRFKKKESSLSLSVSDHSLHHSPQQNSKIKREKEIEQRSKV